MAVSSATAAVAHKAFPQQPASPRRIGVLLVELTSESPLAQQLRLGLLEAGYVEGRDLVIEWRSTDDLARVPELAADLVQRRVEVIVAETTPAAQAVKHATATIPIVMALVADPVGSGLAASLSHPGGNVTGLSMMLADLTTKRLQLLNEAVPRATRVAVVWSPIMPWHPKAIAELKAAASLLAIELTFASVRSPEEFSPAFSSFSHVHAQALYMLDAPLFFAHRRELVNLAAKARLPAIYTDRRFSDEGGLISYGADAFALFRRAAWYVDKILKGAKPGDLPIEQPTKLELIVNLKTATALGITIPESIRLRADELIQ